MKRMMLACALLALATAPVSAQEWLDDFEDGSVADGAPVLWQPSPAFAAAYTVSDGDLVVTMPPGTTPAISSPRVSINFPHGASVRARMRGLNPPGRYTVAFADQPTGIQGYVASFSSCGGGRLELFRGDELGSIVILGTLPWPYGPTQEHLIQLDVFDGVVSARLWRPGEPCPDPQISVVDTTYGEGVASIAIQDFGASNCIPSGNFADVAAEARYMHVSATALTHSDVGDLDANGRVDVSDLVELILGWGPCAGGCPPGCAADVAPAGGDCVVDVQDLVALILNWG